MNCSEQAWNQPGPGGDWRDSDRRRSGPGGWQDGPGNYNQSFDNNRGGGGGYNSGSNFGTNYNDTINVSGSGSPSVTRSRTVRYTVAIFVCSFKLHANMSSRAKYPILFPYRRNPPICSWNENVSRRWNVIKSIPQTFFTVTAYDWFLSDTFFSRKVYWPFSSVRED